jgi:hypothetical protein
MDDHTQPIRKKKRDVLRQLDAIARDLNAVLLALAIGLAVLDGTCFFVLEMRLVLPATPTGGPAPAPPSSFGVLGAP